MSDSYFYTIDRKRHGPVAISVLKEMAVKAELRRTDMIWCDGMSQWQPAASIEGIFEGLPPDLEPPSGTPSKAVSEASHPVAAETTREETYLPAIEKAVATGKAVSKIIRKETSGRFSRFKESLPKQLQNKRTFILLTVLIIVVALVSRGYYEQVRWEHDRPQREAAARRDVADMQKGHGYKSGQILAKASRVTGLFHANTWTEVREIGEQVWADPYKFEKLEKDWLVRMVGGAWETPEAKEAFLDGFVEGWSQ